MFYTVYNHTESDSLIPGTVLQMLFNVGDFKPAWRAGLKYEIVLDTAHSSRHPPMLFQLRLE